MCAATSSLLQPIAVMASLLSLLIMGLSAEYVRRTRKCIELIEANRRLSAEATGSEDE
jgi:hypothetical protein